MTTAMSTVMALAAAVTAVLAARAQGLQSQLTMVNQALALDVQALIAALMAALLAALMVQILQEGLMARGLLHPWVAASWSRLARAHRRIRDRRSWQLRGGCCSTTP